MVLNAKAFTLAAIILTSATHTAMGDEIKPTNFASQKKPSEFIAYNCAEARESLGQEGFRRLVAIDDCKGVQYKFQGDRGNARYVIVFSSESGGWISLPR